MTYFAESPHPTFFLRHLRQDDAPMLLKARNDEHIRDLMLTNHIISAEEHQRWIDKRLASPHVPYFLFQYGDIPCGLIGLSHFEEAHGQGDWGFYLWATNLPAGAGTHMLSAFLEEIFMRRKLRKLCSQVLCANEKSLHLHYKLGFTQEGLLKEQVLRQGRLEDVILFALFHQEWEKQRDNFKSYLKNVAFLNPK